MSHRLQAAAYGAIVLALSALAMKRSFASDHADSPSLSADPTVDIADVYAFMRPEGAGPTFAKSTHLVAAMTVHPSATAAAEFEPYVDYALNIVGIDDPALGLVGTLDAAVTCRFYPADGQNDAGLPTQAFTCAANGAFFSGTTNQVSGAPSDALRVFAGLRSDPAFGDVPGVLGAVRSGALPTGDGGVNTFAGKNVLAIVAELDVKRVLFADAGATVLGVSASTDRQ